MKFQLLRHEAERLWPAWLIALLGQCVPPMLQWGTNTVIPLFLLSALGITAWTCRWPWRPAHRAQTDLGTARDYWDIKCLLLAMGLLLMALVPMAYLYVAEPNSNWPLASLHLLAAALALSTTIPLLVLWLKNVWSAMVLAVLGLVLFSALLFQAVPWLVDYLRTNRGPDEFLFLDVVLYQLYQLGGALVLAITCGISYVMGIRTCRQPDISTTQAHRLSRLDKECRKLLSPWTMGLALICVAAFSQESGYVVLAGFLTAGILAAAVFGNELNHQTLGLLLAQPVSRRRLWYEKMFALSVALLTVVLAEWVMLTLFIREHNFPDSSFNTLSLVALFAIFTTVPMLTLLVRNSLAAIVFTPLIYFLLCMSVIGTGHWLGGDAYADYETFIQQLCLFICLGMSALAYLAGCGLFQRYECRETMAVDLRLPNLRSWLPGRGADWRPAVGQGRGGWLSQLVGKELHLHRINLLLAGLFCLGCLAMVGLHFMKMRAQAAGDTTSFEFANEPFYLTPFFIYWILAPLLMGSVGIAEERQLGILDWHLVLPPSRCRQWWCKLLSAYGVSFVLAMVLPAAWLGSVYWPLGMMGVTSEFEIWTAYPWICLVLLLATSVSVYAASFSANTMKAIINSLGLIIAGIVVCGVFSNYLHRHGLSWPYHFGLVVWPWDTVGLDDNNSMLNVFRLYVAETGLLVLFFLGMLGLSYGNFKRSEHSWHHTLLVPTTLAVVIGLGLSAWLMVFQEVKRLGLI